MNQATFDNDKATAVENAVSEVFGCRVSEIVSIQDTLVKKVAVFVLATTENYNSRILGLNYQISYLYVPMVIAEMEFMIKVVPGFDQKIINVYEKMDRFREASTS